MKACAKAFHEAERISPNDPVTQTYLGRLYLRQRRWAEAERAFRLERSKVDPDSAGGALRIKCSVAAAGPCRRRNRSRATCRLVRATNFPRRTFNSAPCFHGSVGMRERCRPSRFLCDCGPVLFWRIDISRAFTQESIDPIWPTATARKLRAC